MRDADARETPGGQERPKPAALEVPPDAREDIENLLASLDSIGSVLHRLEAAPASLSLAGAFPQDSLPEYYRLLIVLADAWRDGAVRLLSAAGVGDADRDRIIGLLDDHPSVRQRLAREASEWARKINPWRSIRQHPEFHLQRGWPQAEVTISSSGGTRLCHFRDDLDDVVGLSSALAQVVVECLNSWHDQPAAIADDALNALDRALRGLGEVQTQAAEVLKRLSEAKTKVQARH